MVIAILLLVLGSQVLPSDCLTVDICSNGEWVRNARSINISSPGYPNTHEILPSGLRCSCFVRTAPRSTDTLVVSPIEVSYTGCDRRQCDSSCWSSLDFWASSHLGDSTVCLPQQSNFTTNVTLVSTILTNVTFAASARNPAFTYAGKFLFSIRARQADRLMISCHSGLTTTPRSSTTIPSTSSTTKRKSRTTRTSEAPPSTTRSSTHDISSTETTTSGTPTISTGSTSTTGTSTSTTGTTVGTSSSVDRETTVLSSTVTATTTVSTTATTTMMPDTSTTVGETTTSTVTDRSTTASDAVTSRATETVTETAATSTAPDKSTPATVSSASTASETKVLTTDTQTSMATSAASSSGTDTSTTLTGSSSRPTTSSTFRDTSADLITSTVVSIDLHSSAVHNTSGYSETSWYEDSTTVETSTATPTPSRKLIMLAIILAIILFILILILIIIWCVRKRRRNAKMIFESDLCVVKMSDLESDVQSPDAQPIMSPGRKRSCPLPLHLLLQKTAKKNRDEASSAASASAAYDKAPCCRYKRQTSESYLPMGQNPPGRRPNTNTSISPNVYADLDQITNKQSGNPIITITDTDGEYYNRSRSPSQQSDNVHAYETCYSPDGATKRRASSEYEHTYASIQGRKESIDSLKTESPYSTINEDQLYSNISDGRSDETDKDKKRDED